jgi:prophage regulatory protein
MSTRETLGGADPHEILRAADPRDPTQGRAGRGVSLQPVAASTATATSPTAATKERVEASSTGKRSKKASKAEQRERRRRRRLENRQAALAATKISGRNRILKLAEVETAVGLKRSVLYELIAAGSFPAPIALTPTARGWLEDEIDRWLDERVAARDAGAVA